MDRSDAIFIPLVIIAGILTITGLTTKNYLLLFMVVLLIFIPAFDAFESIS